MKVSKRLLIISYLSRSLADHWGTTVEFTTSFLHSSRFSAFHFRMFHGKQKTSHRKAHQLFIHVYKWHIIIIYCSFSSCKVLAGAKISSTASTSMWQHVTCLNRSVPGTHIVCAGSLSHKPENLRFKTTTVYFKRTRQLFCFSLLKFIKKESKLVQSRF